MTDDPGNSGEPIEFFPVAIGQYDHHSPLPVDPEVRQLHAVLAEFGARENRWETAMSDRGADAVDSRLRLWARPAQPANTVLHWVGHGWSDGFDVALAHARSPATVRASGVLPAHLAESIRTRQATCEGHWAIVIIETCWSSRFVDKVNALLAGGLGDADGVMLIGVSGDGATALGRFRAAVSPCLQENFRSNKGIELWRLAGELDRRLTGGLVVGRRLGRSALHRATTPIASSISVPLDVLRQLEEVINQLGKDERRHFLAKAQAAEEGEITWFFQGRIQETGVISRWLRNPSFGLLVVTGPAGSGKSALLGQVLVHSLPDLRETLIRAGLVEPIPASEAPLEKAFDGVMHLAGMSLPAFIARVAAAAGLGEPPGLSSSGKVVGVARDVAWLIDTVASQASRLTLLVDAMDEAEDPLALASTVLRPLSRLPNVRLVIGTRASTRESPDFSAQADADLLVALGITGDDVDRVLVVERDDEAVARYVAKRLSVARSQDRALRALPDDLLVRAAHKVAGRHRHFLFARLAVYELIARPELLDPSMLESLDVLLDGDHRDLFRTAVERLGVQRPQFRPLLEALALGRGRGVPIRDGIWAVMANSLREVGEETIRDQDISDLLGRAQPYIAIDEQDLATVYRLAHRTFVEHFRAMWNSYA